MRGASTTWSRRSSTTRSTRSSRGPAREIDVTVHSDGSCSVKDNGRGIPVEEHPKYHRPTLEIVMTVLHAGSKFDRNTYKVSGGLHGVGVHVVNALCEWFEVRVRRDGHEYFQRYEQGAPVAPLEIVGDAETTGTEARFKPDGTILETINFDEETIERRLKELSFLNAGVTIDFHDERDGTDDVPPRRRDRRVRRGPEHLVDPALPAPHLPSREAGHDRHRGRAPVQRRLQRDDARVREQHPHGGRRDPRRRAARRAHPHAQRLRAQARVRQGRQGGTHRRGRPGGADRGPLRQGPRTAVRGADEG